MKKFNVNVLWKWSLVIGGAGAIWFAGVIDGVRASQVEHKDETKETSK